MGSPQCLFIDSAISWCPALGSDQKRNGDETRIEECHGQTWISLRQLGLQAFQAKALLNNLSKSLGERPIGTTLAGHHGPGTAPSQTDLQTGKKRSLISRMNLKVNSTEYVGGRDRLLGRLIPLGKTTIEF